MSSIYSPSSSLSAICLSVRSSSPQRYRMLAGSDLAWGAIVLSLIKQWIKASDVERQRGRALLVVAAGVVSGQLPLESTC